MPNKQVELLLEQLQRKRCAAAARALLDKAGIEDDPLQGEWTAAEVEELRRVVEPTAAGASGASGNQPAAGAAKGATRGVGQEGDEQKSVAKRAAKRKMAVATDEAAIATDRVVEGAVPDLKEEDGDVGAVATAASKKRKATSSCKAEGKKVTPVTVEEIDTDEETTCCSYQPNFMFSATNTTHVPGYVFVEDGDFGPGYYFIGGADSNHGTSKRKTSDAKVQQAAGVALVDDDKSAESGPSRETPFSQLVRAQDPFSQLVMANAQRLTEEKE